LTWPAAVVNSTNTPVLDYKIERATTANFTTGLTTLSTTTTAVSFTDTTASTNTLYYYRVSARNSIGYSGFASTSITSAKITSSITLTGPASTYFSDAQTFTATVSPAVAGRTVTFYRAGVSVGTATTVLNAKQQAVASISYTTAEVINDVSWTASVASTSVYTDATSAAFKASVVAMPLTVTIGNSRSGTTVTLSATTTDRHGTAITGTTRTYQRRYYGQTWENTTTSFNISESYAVRVTASKTNYVTTTSAVSTTYVSQTVPEADNNASASRSYEQDNTLRDEIVNGTDLRYQFTRLYQGYYSSNQKIQKAAIWFEVPWGRINNAHAVTDLKVRLKRGPSGGSGGEITVFVGTHNDGTVRNNWNEIAGKVTARTSVNLARGATKDVSLNGLNIDTTTLKGILIGKPEGGADYGWLYGNENPGDQPDLIVTYQADPHK
jgi:hypothetical protein